MAAAELRAELLCSIDMEIYKDPVTLPCGHSFCRDCITRTFDHQEEGEYRCPECQRRFKRRPELVGTLRLSNIADACTTSHQEESGVFCTFCDFPVPADKSCLQCETSMCGKHVTRHNMTALEHTLLPPSTDLGKRKCAIHKKILEFYCKEDGAYICVSCRLDGDHMRHEVEPLDKAAEDKKEKLRHIRQVLASREEGMMKNIQSLQEFIDKLHKKAAAVSETVIERFQYVKRQLDLLQERVLSEISRQDEEASLDVTDLIEQLQRRKDECSEKMADIEELCRMNDPVTLLRESVDDYCEAEDSDDDTDQEDHRIHYVDEILEGTDLKSLLEYLSTIITSVKTGIYNYEPAAITLGVTSGNNLHIAGDLYTVHATDQNSPDTPDRLEYLEALSIEKFSSGKYYWDLEISDSGGWRAGVSYSRIARKGYQCLIGDNDKSWCLCRYDNNSWARHQGKDIRLPHTTSCGRLRVCLDYDEGRLSFYELTAPIKHLHTFTPTFTEPLHAAIALWGRSRKDIWVKVLRN